MPIHGQLLSASVDGNGASSLIITSTLPSPAALGAIAASARGAANGVAPLGASSLVPVANLGSGTPTGLKFLRDDGTFAVPAGGAGGTVSLFGRYRTGRYYSPFLPGQTTTTGTLTNGRLYLFPLLIEASTSFDRFAIETTIAASAGGVFRCLIYNDSSGYPGSLNTDMGTIDLTAAFGPQEKTIALTLSAGLYWIGGAEQGAPATEATMRLVNASSPAPPLGWASNANANAPVTWLLSAVTGTPPDPFTAGQSTTTNGPHIKLRAA